MILPLKSWYRPDEAATHMTSLTGQTVNIAQIVDWGFQGRYGLFLMQDCHVQCGYEDGVELAGGTVSIALTATQSAALSRGETIQASSGLHEKRDCYFVKLERSSSRGPKEWTRKPVMFDRRSLAIPGQELNGFVAAIAPPTTEGRAGTRWPEHETHALAALRMAAVKWWGNYDPKDPSTAPTNAVVSEWLAETHKISATLAAAMATILRPESLKTGPRPKN